MQVLNYQVVTGAPESAQPTIEAHTSVSDHTFGFIAEAEARRWNEAYQTDTYRVLALMEDGSRRFV